MKLMHNLWIRLAEASEEAYQQFSNPKQQGVCAYFAKEARRKANQYEKPQGNTD